MKIKKGFVKRKVGDKYLVVSTKKIGGQSMFIELNETSSFIWDLVSKGYNEEKIASSYSERYSISAEKAKEDVNKIIDSMKNANVLED